MAPRTCRFEASSGEDYPDLPNEDGAPLFSVQAGRLMDRIKRTGYAAEKPSAHARPIGSCIQFSGNSIFALDGRPGWHGTPMKALQRRGSSASSWTFWPT